MWAVATRKGMVTFASRGEYDEWYNTGTNRWLVLGKPEIIEETEPVHEAVFITVYAVPGTAEEPAIRFFEDYDDALGCAGGNELIISQWTKEVLV